MPNLILNYSCSATAKSLHCGATRISQASKLTIFKPNFLMILIFRWLITCVKDFDMCSSRNNHANRCCLEREGDRGDQQLRLGELWQINERAEIDGKGVLHTCIMKLETKWSEEICPKSGSCSYRGDWGLSQLQRRFRAFSLRQLEANWTPKDTCIVKFDNQTAQGFILSICNKTWIRYSTLTW